jgi:hypothetical protein
VAVGEGTIVGEVRGVGVGVALGPPIAGVGVLVGEGVGIGVGVLGGDDGGSQLCVGVGRGVYPCAAVEPAPKSSEPRTITRITHPISRRSASR